jgi:hypothetical protein
MLTEVAIRTLAAADSRREIPDGKVTGLYLVVQPSGAKSWALRYRARGKPKKLTIGPYPLVAIAEARRHATAALGDVATGKDPAAEKTSARAAARAEKDDMVDAVVNDFVKLYAARNTRDWRETERILKKDVVSRWRGRRLGDIERKDVAKLLDEMIDRGAPVGANRVFAQCAKCARGRSSAESFNSTRVKELLVPRRRRRGNGPCPTTSLRWYGEARKVSASPSDRLCPRSSSQDSGATK